MSTPRKNVVRLRLTELERESWGKAAGGKGKLSEWIRAQCNRAAMSDDEPLGAPPLPLILFAEPNKDQTENPEPTIAVSSECPRWMHHRSGVYCGSCKQVIR